MRKLLLLGATGLVLALGAAGANAQSIQNRPEASPYAILNQQPAPSNGLSNGVLSLVEGRAAFTQDAAGNSAPVAKHHRHSRSLQ